MTGITATHVDDTRTVEYASFEKRTNETSNRLESKTEEFDSIRFSGIYIESLKNRSQVHQNSYVDRLQELTSDSYCKSLRHMADTY